MCEIDKLFSDSVTEVLLACSASILEGSYFFFLIIPTLIFSVDSEYLVSLISCGPCVA